jgi:hypothetical protein
VDHGGVRGLDCVAGLERFDPRESRAKTSTRAAVSQVITSDSVDILVQVVVHRCKNTTRRHREARHATQLSEGLGLAASIGA